MSISSPGGIVCVLIVMALLGSCRGGMRATSINQVREDLTAGHFQKALDRCQDEYRGNPKETERLKQYVEAIEYIKAFADMAFQREEFISAGGAYALLLKNFPRFKPFASTLSFEKNHLTLRIRTSQILILERQVSSHLNTGNIQRVIDLYQDLHQRGPPDPVVQRDYISLLEQIKTHADLAFERNDPVLAGCIYRILLRNFSAFRPIGHFLSYNRELLNTNIKKCKKRLFENGLEQYRAGNLTIAISTWKSILIFDPENTEVKKALTTALAQSKNLERDKTNDAK